MKSTRTTGDAEDWHGKRGGSGRGAKNSRWGGAGCQKWWGCRNVLGEVGGDAEGICRKTQKVSAVKR
ncbi:hypothetical protein E2C01_042360 [Portunus trituberculatus]|uniref:Uncharacterized protein n=1 Tax=Portunus trituberculatus TaxID=210409 RepID=A0A5B7FUF7_PORTR|nr:hypothetical protein [Portunus trituberculatus]